MKDQAIETPRLHLVPFGSVHLTERYVGWLGDAEVVRWSEQRYRKHTLDSCREYVGSFDGTPNMLFAIVAKDDKVGHLGNINAYVDERHGVADIGILLGERAAWGKGYGREAWGALLHALLQQPGIRKVTGGCVANNVGMVQVMRATSMVEDGRRVRQYVYDGLQVDVVYYAAFAAQGAGAP